MSLQLLSEIIDFLISFNGIQEKLVKASSKQCFTSGTITTYEVLEVMRSEKDMLKSMLVGRSFYL